MSRISLDEIESRVRDIVAGSPLAGAMRGVAVEEAEDLNDDSLLRVIVAVHRPDRIETDAAFNLVRDVRLGMMDEDDRFLIVQFAEAA